MLDRRDFLATLPGGLALLRLEARAEGRAPILGAWSGAVGASVASLKVLTRDAGLPVVLTLLGEGGSPHEQALSSDADGVATFSLTGLQPRTRYRYLLGAPGQAALEGGFRTFADGPFSFRVVFASCASTGSASPVFTSMRRQQADLFVHMGDLHYEDIGRDDVARFRAAYARVLSSPTQSALFRSVPVAYMWDDHDYGPNDSDRGSPSRRSALQAYRRFVPHYPLAEGREAPVHQAFDVGRVRFLMTDPRSARAPRRLPEDQRTMLGRSQLAWLEQQLESARSAPLVVWVNTIPWITKSDESTREGWAPYARERRRLADLVTRLGLNQRLVMLSGDAHMLALDDGTHSQYSTLPGAPGRGFVVAHAAPMDRRPSTKGGPYTHGPSARSGQFGVMDVIDDGAGLRVVLQGWRGDAPVSGLRLEIRPEGPSE